VQCKLQSVSDAPKRVNASIAAQNPQPSRPNEQGEKVGRNL